MHRRRNSPSEFEQERRTTGVAYTSTAHSSQDTEAVNLVAMNSTRPNQDSSKVCGECEGSEDTAGHGHGNDYDNTNPIAADCIEPVTKNTIDETVYESFNEQ